MTTATKPKRRSKAPRVTDVGWTPSEIVLHCPYPLGVKFGYTDQRSLTAALCRAVDKVLWDYERGLQSEGKP